jgi:hypothetical protein
MPATGSRFREIRIEPLGDVHAAIIGIKMTHYSSQNASIIHQARQLYRGRVVTAHDLDGF